MDNKTSTTAKGPVDSAKTTTAAKKEEIPAIADSEEGSAKKQLHIRFVEQDRDSRPSELDVIRNRLRQEKKAVDQMYEAKYNKKDGAV